MDWKENQQEPPYFIEETHGFMMFHAGPLNHGGPARVAGALRGQQPRWEVDTWNELRSCEPSATHDLLETST